MPASISSNNLERISFYAAIALGCRARGLSCMKESVRDDRRIFAGMKRTVRIIVDLQFAPCLQSIRQVVDVFFMASGYIFCFARIGDQIVKRVAPALAVVNEFEARAHDPVLMGKRGLGHQVNRPVFVDSRLDQTDALGARMGWKAEQSKNCRQT